jgi:uncharacterized protein
MIMKYLLVIVLVWVAYMIWRAGRRNESRAAPPPAAAPPAVPAPQDMARCAHCGLHLPAADALPGKDGKVYCSAAHRQADQ